MLRKLIAPLVLASSLNAEKVDYNFDIKPILSDRCFLCHGFDEAHRAADLRLDLPEAAFATRKGVTPIVPGKPEESEVWKRITSVDPDEVMPTPESHLTLSQKEKDLIKRWIEEGAEYQKHWAFIPPEKPNVPKVKSRDWVNNPIDAFILARLEKEKLQPSPPAEPATLKRRLALDLTGLPPGENDSIQTLLNSPHFGERWALPWLDAGRYADSNGFQGDPNNFHYAWRDYVIRSLNDNKPVSQFITELLAGDLLENPTDAQLVATAFNRMHPISNEGGAIRSELLYNYRVDRVDAVATTFLGLTFACAQCHDHKYDPLSHQDFYRFMAFFGNIEEEGMPRERINAEHHHYLLARPTHKLPVPEIDALLAERQEELTAYLAKNKEVHRKYRAAFHEWATTVDIEAESKKDGFSNWHLNHLKSYRKNGKLPEKQWQEITRYFRTRVAKNPAWDHFMKGRDAAEAHLAKVDSLYPRVMVMKEKAGPAQQKLHDRGLYDSPVGEPLAAGIPEALGSLPEGPANRLTLARWLTSRDNPLTARVFVNRIWQELFGTGIVKTSEDFGFQAALPSHPDLLDWLAVEFQESGWDFKKLIHLIISSNTYQQSSRASSLLLERDPENRLLARGSRFRLPSSLIRDYSLAVSGLLDRKQFGPPVYPHQPEGLWKDVSFEKFRYPRIDNPTHKYRRSIYTFWRRTLAPPNMFDAANRQMCSVKSSRTNTPLQALTLLNDRIYVESALALARAVGDESDTLKILFEKVTTRPSTSREHEIIKRAFDRELKAFQSRPEDVKKLTSSEDPRLAALTVVAQMILNLDETLTKE